MTEWKSIIGYENEYLVSNNGDVFSLRSKKRLKPSINEKGYMRVCLQKRGMKSWKRVNRLVAEAFIPNPEDKPTVNHKNGIRDDNHVWNLEWATVLEQNSDPMRMKNMSKSMMRSEYVLRKKRKVLHLIQTVLFMQFTKDCMMRNGLLERQQETFFFAAMDNGKPVKDLNFNTLPTALYVMQGIAEALKGGEG